MAKQNTDNPPVVSGDTNDLSSASKSGVQRYVATCPEISLKRLEIGDPSSVTSTPRATDPKDTEVTPKSEQRGRRMSSKAHTPSTVTQSAGGTLKTPTNTVRRGRLNSGSYKQFTTGSGSNMADTPCSGSLDGQIPLSSAATSVRPVPLADAFDQFEKEQEAMVNKLQREISYLKSERSRSRSQSTSSSSSISRNTSLRSVKSIQSDSDDVISHNLQPQGPTGPTGRQRNSFSGAPEDNSPLQTLRRENDVLKKKLAAVSIKLTEKESEIEHLRKLLRAPNE